MGTITWEDFVIGARHILQVSDSICDGWSLCGTLNENNGGYLAKKINKPIQVLQPTVSDEIGDDFPEEDPCTMDSDSSVQLEFKEFHVLYSLAHSVPTIYIKTWRSDGSSLDYNELWRDFSAGKEELLLDPSERFRTLTQQEHPFLGEPWYQLHPCRTAAMMDQVGGNDPGEDPRIYFIRWISTFAPMVGCPISHQYITNVNKDKTMDH